MKHILGKDEVSGSIPDISSMETRIAKGFAGFLVSFFRE